LGVSPWAAKLLRRKPAKLVAVALAKKAARVAWAVMTGFDPLQALRLEDWERPLLCRGNSCIYQ